MDHHRTRIVFFGEDDASGFIHFASYFRYMAEGEQELLRAVGIDYRVLQEERGITAPTVHAECQCRRPARTGDELCHDVHLELGRRSSFTTHHQFHRSTMLACEGTLTHSFIDLASGTSVPVPEDLRARLQ